jgi:hypothetical protein
MKSMQSPDSNYLNWNEILIPSNLKLIASNLILIPSNLTLIPSNLILIPSNLTLIPSNLILIPSNITFQYRSLISVVCSTAAAMESTAHSTSPAILN